MKVLQISTHLNIGGIPTYIYTLTKYLLRNNIEVAVASSGGVWEKKLISLGAQPFRIPIKSKNEFSPKLLPSLFELYKIKKKFNFQLLHSHTRITQVLSQIFSKLTHTPHVANFHGFYSKNKMRMGRKIIKAQGIRSIAITPYVKNDLVNIFGANEDRVKTIVSGIDLESLRIDMPPLALEGQPKIGTSGRLSDVKGFKHLIMCLPILLKKYPNARLYIRGEGKQENSLLALAKELKVERHFRIIKNVESVSFLRALDIFCLPSLEEPLGLAVIEAQYCGIPCIVSRVDGLKILVKNSKTGMLTPPKNPEALAQIIITLLTDDNLRKRISENSIIQVKKEFDIAKKIEKFISVYQEVLNENPAI